MRSSAPRETAILATPEDDGGRRVRLSSRLGLRRGPRLDLRPGLLLATLLAAVSGCAREAAPCEPAISTVLRVAVPNPQAPRVNNMLPPIYLTDVPLVMVNDRGLPEPGLAKSWSTPDRQTWTLTLRDDLRTHAGTWLTAARLRESLLRKLTARVTYDAVARDLVGIDAPDDRTLVVRLRRPSSAFLESLHYTGLAEASEGPKHADEPDVSVGSLRLLQRTDTSMELARFPDSSTDPRALSGVKVSFYPSVRAAWAAFLRDEADFLYDVPPGAASLLARNPDVELYPTSGRHQFTLTFNVTRPRLRDPHVRQAIDLAIDREEIARTVLGGYARPSSGPFFPHYWALDDGPPARQYDPVTALRLLREAAAGRPQPLELECLTTPEYPLAAEIAAALEVQLARVNITLRMVSLEPAAFAGRVQAGDFEMAITPLLMGRGPLWPQTFWHSSATPAFIRPGYNGADAALDALYTAASPEAERRAAQEVVEVMRRDPPAAFILPVPVIRAVRHTWRVPPPTAESGDVRQTLAQWTLAAAPCGAP